jgi:hypothetical protein
MKWEPLRSSDLSDVDGIANTIHVTLPERIEVLAEKISLYPDYSRKLIANDEVVGYGIAHPWSLYDIPALDAFFTHAPAAPDCIYAHDVAILQKARGHRSSVLYIDHLKRIAADANIRHLACVSVYGTHKWWGRLGFEIKNDPRLAEKLPLYGQDACYMVADL